MSEFLSNASQIRSDGLITEILDGADNGLAVFDDNAALVLCNSRFRELNPLISSLLVPGMAWEMLLRQAVQRMALAEEEAERLRVAETQLADGASTVQPVEFQTATDATHTMSLRQSSSGGFIVIHRDITAERHYAQGDQQADVLLRKVLEACPANIVMSRIGDGQILYRSPAATELLGAARCYYDHFASREERADFITALLPDGRVDDIQVTGLRADGSRFPCRISARVIDYRGEDVMVSNTVDITKELALQAKLAEQREQIFQAEKMSALGELLAGVAHELNNPLSVVVGHALMLREELADQEAQRRIEKISNAAERCARIVKSFLAMARQQPARLAPAHLGDIVDTAIDALRQGASGLQSAVDLDLDPHLPAILADADQISQVLINLLANSDQAVTASGVGGVIKVVARHVRGEDAVLIRVADNGPGIPAAIRKRIFDPLFTTKEVGKGTGIGLAFVHRVITSHNGQIQLDAATDRGASFTIRLPVAHRHDERSGNEREAVRAATQARVLVIEDEDDVADLIREVLSRDGLKVDHVGSAEAALAVLGEQSYALILTDLNMPGLGGRELYRRILRDRPALASKIAFVTGDSMSPSARSFLDSANRPCLEKPLAPGELRRLVRSVLADSNHGVGS